MKKIIFIFCGLCFLSVVTLIYIAIKSSIIEAVICLMVASIVALVVSKISGNVYSLKPFYKILNKDA